MTIECSRNSPPIFTNFYEQAANFDEIIYHPEKYGTIKKTYPERKRNDETIFKKSGGACAVPDNDLGSDQLREPFKPDQVRL